MRNLRRIRSCLAAPLFLLLAAASGCAASGSVAEVPRAVFNLEARKDGGEQAVEILDIEVHIRADEQGRWTRTFRRKVRILSQDALETWDNIEHSWRPWFEERPSVRALVRDPQGAAHPLDPRTISVSSSRAADANLYTDEMTLRAPLPAVTVGSQIEEEYVSKAHRPFFDGGYVFRELVAVNSPIRQIKVTFDVPESVPARYEVRGLKLDVSDTKTGGRRVISLSAKDVPALKMPEPYLPEEVVRFPYVAFSTGDSWAKVARAYAKLVDERVTDSAVQALARSVASPSEPPESRIRKAVAAVRAGIRYEGLEFGESSIVPHYPSEVLKRRYGDCKDQAVLLVALLRELGISARVALLSTGPGPDVEPSLPGLNAFDHAIVVIPGDTPIWIDPTSPYAPPGELPPADEARLALIADPSTEGLVKTWASDAKTNVYSETRAFTLADWGPAKVVETTSARGGIEQILRSNYDSDEARNNRKGVEEYVKEQYAADALGGYDPGSSRDLSKPFTVTMEALGARKGFTALDDAAVELDYSMLFSWIPRHFRQQDVSERKEDVLLPFAHSAELNYTIRPPIGYELAPIALPSAKLGPFKLDQSTRQDASGEVHVSLRLTVPERRVTAADIQAFAKGHGELVSRPAPKVVFEHVGARLLSQGKARDGFDAYRRLIDKAPKVAVHRLRYALALFSMGLGDAARDELRRAIQVDPLAAHLHFQLGYVLMHDPLGRELRPGFDRSGAIAAFKKALELDPSDADSAYNLALVLEHDDLGRRYKGDLQAALEQYRKIQDRLADVGELAPVNPLHVLLRLRRYQELFDQAKRLEHAQKHQLVAAAAAMLRGAPAAARELDGAGLTRERRAESLSAAASLLAQVGEYATAKALLDIAATNAPNSLDLLRNAQLFAGAVPRASLRLTKSSPLDAARLFFAELSEHGKITDGMRASVVSSRFQPSPEETSGRPPDDWEKSALGTDILLNSRYWRVDGNDRLGYRVIMGGLPTRNMRLVYFVVKEGAEYRVRAYAPEGVREIGREALQALDAGDAARAKQWLDWGREEAVSQSISSAGAFLSAWPASGDPRLAALLLATAGGSTKDLIAPLQKAAGGVKDTQIAAVVHRTLFRLLADEERYREANEVASRMASIKPDEPDTLALKAVGLLFSGAHAEARGVVEKLISEGKATNRLYGLLGMVEVREGKFEKARARLREAVDKGMADSSTYNNLAWLSLFTGGATDADIDLALRAVNGADAGQTAALHTLATLYADMGRVKEAHSTLEKVLAARSGGRIDPVDWLVIGRIAEHCGLPEDAKRAYARVTGRADNHDSAAAVAKRRVAALASGRAK